LKSLVSSVAFCASGTNHARAAPDIAWHSSKAIR